MQHDDWSSRRNSLSPEPYFHLRRSDIPAPPLLGDDRHYERPPEPSFPPPPTPPDAYRRRVHDTESLPILNPRNMQWDPPNPSRSSGNHNHVFWRSADQWDNGAGPSNGSNAAWRRSTYEPAAGWNVPREEKRRSFPHEDPIPVHTLRLVGPFQQPDTPTADNRSSQQQPRHYPSSSARDSWVRVPSPPPPFYLPQQRPRQQSPQQQRHTDARPGTWSLDDIVKDEIDPSTLSRQTLENILLVDYANSLNELEFPELAPQVARLANKRRKELAASESQESSDALLCKLCCDLQMDCVFLDCGHLASCMTCAQKIISDKNECPICRRRVSRRLRIYTS